MPDIRLNLGFARIRVEWDGRRQVNRPARVISYGSGFVVGWPGDWHALDGEKNSIGQGFTTKRKAQAAIRAHESQ
jgi:hypothetical protein